MHTKKILINTIQVEIAISQRFFGIIHGNHYWYSFQYCPIYAVLI